MQDLLKSGWDHNTEQQVPGIWNTTTPHMADAKSTPSYSLDLHFIGFITIVRPMMTISVRNKKSKVCEIGGVQYVPKLSLTGIDPRFV